MSHKTNRCLYMDNEQCLLLNVNVHKAKAHPWKTNIESIKGYMSGA